MFNVLCAGTYCICLKVRRTRSSRAGFQSRRPRCSLTETRTGFVVTSGVLFVCHELTVLLFSGTCDSGCELYPVVAFWQTFLKGTSEFSVKFIVPPAVHIHLPLLLKCNRPDQTVHFLTLGPQLFYHFWCLRMKRLRPILSRDTQHSHI